MNAAAEWAKGRAGAARGKAEASERHAEEMERVREELEEARVAEIAELKMAHAMDLEKRQGALKTTREQLKETVEQVSALRDQHERSAADARAAEATA